MATEPPDAPGAPAGQPWYRGGGALTALVVFALAVVAAIVLIVILADGDEFEDAEIRAVQVSTDQSRRLIVPPCEVGDEEDGEQALDGGQLPGGLQDESNVVTFEQGTGTRSVLVPPCFEDDGDDDFGEFEATRGAVTLLPLGARIETDDDDDVDEDEPIFFAESVLRVPEGTEATAVVVPRCGAFEEDDEEDGGAEQALGGPPAQVQAVGDEEDTFQLQPEGGGDDVLLAPTCEQAEEQAGENG